MKIPFYAMFSLLAAGMAVNSWNVAFSAEQSKEFESAEETGEMRVSDDEILRTKVGQKLVVEDFAEIDPFNFSFTDSIYSHHAGYKPDEIGDIISFLGNDFEYGYESGADAEIGVLFVDITNLDVEENNFLEDVEVKAVFQEKYTYDGYGIQYNYDISNTHIDKPVEEVAIHPDDNYAIGPMYVGHYGFFCFLPNRIVESNDPLRYEIRLGDRMLEFVVR